MEKTTSKRSRQNKMNILFPKDKIMDNDKPDSPASLAFASGDGVVPESRCTLCSSVANVKNICVDHCDEALRRIFDVEVPNTAKICEPCIKCLKVCERFKVLVNTSFVKKPRFGTPSCDQSTETERSELPANPQKEIIELLTASLTNRKPKKKSIKTAYTPSEAPAKRVNIACTICQQKYLMLEQGKNNFICSRCKHKELKIVGGKKASSLPANELHSKNNLLKKNRLNAVQKYPHPDLTKPKHQCTLCPKCYMDPLHLAKHVRIMHDPCYVCNVCGKRIKKKEAYQEHMKLHPSSNNVSTYNLKRSSFKMASDAKFESITWS